MEKNGLLVEGKHMPSSILSTLNEMRKSGVWCDLRLEIPATSNDAELDVFPVHGCVVAAASKSLAVLVDKKLEHAVLRNLDSRAMSLCINYIYGKGIFVPFSDVPELMKCAQQLQLSALVDVCKTGLGVKHAVAGSGETDCVLETRSDDMLPKEEQPDGEALQSDINAIEIPPHAETDDAAECCEDTIPTPDNEELFDVEEQPEIRRPKLYSCSQCPLKFNRVSLLEHHERKHREGAAVPTLLNCSLCHFSASTRREAALHKAWHARGNELRCDDCKLAFKIALDLESHVSKKHPSGIVLKTEGDQEDNALSTVDDEAVLGVNKNTTPLAETLDTLNTPQEQELLAAFSAEHKTDMYIDDRNDVKPKFEAPDNYIGGVVNDDDPDFLPENCEALSEEDPDFVPEGVCERKAAVLSPPKRRRLKATMTKRFKPKSKSSKSATAAPDDSEQSRGRSQPRKRRFSSTLTIGLKKFKGRKSETNIEECDFVAFADELGVPEEVRPLLEPEKWPDYLQQGRFKRNPKAAYKIYYINQFKEYNCEVCGELIRGKQRYDIHRKKEKGQYVYCSFCAKAFISQGSLKTHEMRHKNQKDVQCNLCDFSCYYKHKLKVHMQNAHGELGGPVAALHLCSQCPKTFKSAQSLNVHEMRIHNKETWKKQAPAHRCEQCDYVGFSKRDVDLHQARHSKEKPHVCYICRRYAFKRVKELNKHIRVKHDEEPKPAKYRTLATSSVMVKEEPPEPLELLPPLPKPIKTYRCPHCEYTTTNPQNLKAHVVIHSDSRPYQCPICAYSFKRKNVMVRHAWRLHKIDLRSVCYEKTITGKKKRKELEPKLIFVETPSVQTLVAEGGVDADVLGEVGGDQNAIYTAVDGDGQAIYTTVGDESEAIYTRVGDDSQGMYASVEGDNQAVVLKAEDETYIHNLQLLGAETPKNVDVNVIREVVVDTASVYGDSVLLEGPSSSTHTLSVPITDAAGLTAETQIVIDSNVLKSIGLDTISAAQLKIISDSDS